jgi:tRNA threonylcarbamoyladenosine biosynthesis protein TsaE
MEKNYLSKSEKDTQKLAISMVKGLKGGEVILLNGSIGSGKTIFVKGLAKAMKIKNSPISASFSLLRTYKSRKMTMYHIDLFRVSECEIYNLGLDEFLDDDNAVLAIEWPGPVKKFITGDRLEIDIKLLKNNERKIQIASFGKISDNLLKIMDREYAKK